MRTSKKLIFFALLIVLAMSIVACDNTVEHTHTYDYANIAWTWNADNTEATATVSCSDCEDTAEGHSVTYSATGDAIVKTTTQPTATALGRDSYVATVTIDGTEYYSPAKVVTFKGVNAVAAPTVSGIKCHETPAPGAVATFGTATYKYSKTQDGTYGNINEFEAGTYYVKAYVAGTAYYDAVESAATSFSVTHNNVWVETDTQDYEGCVCGEVSGETFDKVVTAERAELSLSANDSLAIALTGISAYDSVKSISVDSYNFGTDIADLDVPNAFLNDKQKHGEQTMSVVVVKDGVDHTVSVPVLFITEEINSWAGLKKLTPTDAGDKDAIYGYYVLTGNINISGEPDVDAFNFDWEQAGFCGTLDGKNYTITTKSTQTGLFSVLGNGSVVKNLTINDLWYRGYPNVCLLAKAMKGATLDNVTFNWMGGGEEDVITGASRGWLVFGELSSSVLSNITINAQGRKIGSLFGEAMRGNNTFENVTVTADALVEVGHLKKALIAGATEDLIYLVDDVEGVTFIGPCEHQYDVTNIDWEWDADFTSATATLVCTECDDTEEGHMLVENAVVSYEADGNDVLEIRTFTATITIDAAEYTDVVTPSIIYYLGEKMIIVIAETTEVELDVSSYGSVESISCGTHNLGTDLANLSITSDQKTALLAAGNTTLVIVMIDGSIRNTISIPVEFSEVLITETTDTLTASQDIILSAASSSVSLGETYSSATVQSIKYGEYDLGTNLAALTISAALKADTQNHGVQNLTVIVMASESSRVVITVPVLIVTQEIAVIADLYALTRYENGNDVVYGYYRLADGYSDASAAMTGAGNYFWDASKGFRGTLDGNNKTISFTGLIFRGLFGTLGDGAVIKNITLSFAWATQGQGSSILGSAMYGATLDNVTFNIAGSTQTEIGSDRGLIIATVVSSDAKFKSVVVNAQWANISMLLGSKLNYVDGMFTGCTLTVSTERALGEIGHNVDTGKVYAADGSYGAGEVKNGTVTTQEGTISGLTIVRP